MTKESLNIFTRTIMILLICGVYLLWGTITASHIVSFATSNLIGLVATGCFFQFIKEKSGTIWIPVLVHAVLDYSAVLSYN